MKTSHLAKLKVQNKLARIKLFSLKAFKMGILAEVSLTESVARLRGKVRIKLTKLSKKAKQKEPINGVLKEFSPIFARFGPKIAPKIPPLRIKAVALFL